jgi:hypothetical protein
MKVANIFSTGRVVVVFAGASRLADFRILPGIREDIRAFLKANNLEPSLSSTLNFPWLKDGYKEDEEDQA